MIETLTYADLAARLGVSPEAARALAKRHRLPRTKGNDGKALVRVDLADIRHAPMARSKAGRSDGDHAATIEAFRAEIARLETTATGHRADYERERDRADTLHAELLRMTGEAMGARENAARLAGELAARDRPWWRRLTA
jgi:hypothetical protein